MRKNWLIPILFLCALISLVRMVHHLLFPIPFWVQFVVVMGGSCWFTNFYDDKMEGK